MTQKWNLQDIRPAEPRKRRSPEGMTVKARPTEANTQEEADEVMSIKVADGRHKKSRSLLTAILIFLFIVGGGFVASALMGGAEVTVYPRHREPNVNAMFETTRLPKPDELTFEIMTLEAEGERQVSASGQEEATAQAEGIILVYNKQQTDPVRLVTNTRFESPEGYIYKIKDPVVIPGYSEDADGNIIPGVTTAEVYSDEVGEQFNIGPSNFTIPGFAGEPEFSTIYAESIETMSGGFKGMRFIIAEDELNTAQQALRTELRNSLLDRIEAEMPAGFVMFDGAVTFTYVSLPSVAYGDNLATIKEKVLMQIPLFQESEFANFVAAATVPGYEGRQVRIADYSTLTFSYESATTSASNISNAESLSFKLAGRPQIIWVYDEGKLKTDLLGVSKTALPTVLGGYPAIERAEAVIRPFWKTNFPTSLSDINIVESVE